MLPLGCAVALAASAPAFFLASLARRLRSASRLPDATRPGFFSVAGFVFGGSAVTRTGRGWWSFSFFGNCLERCSGHRVYRGF